MNKKIKVLVRILLFLVCLVLVIKGHAMLDKAGVGVMLLGLIGLLGLLWEYNRPYRS